MSKGRLGEIPDKFLLFFGMYPLDRLDMAPPVRIYNLYQNVKTMVPTTLITGTRSGRRWPILKFLITGQLRKTKYVYVEASTSYATETDLLLLLVCRLLKIPTAIYIRDAFQLFPDIYDRSPIKIRILNWLWKRTIQFYTRFANKLLFPSEGLAQQFHFSNAHALLPPAGSPSRSLESFEASKKLVFYVGASTLPNGVDLLLEAMKLVIQKYPEAECVIVTDEAESSDIRGDWEGQDWVRFTSGSFNDLPALMKSAYVTVIPRRKNPYNDLSLPIKLFDYMSFGKPVVVTSAVEQAKIVNEFESGLVVEDNAEDIAQAILRLFDDPALACQLGANGYSAVQGKLSWKSRAEELLTILESTVEGSQRH